MNEKAVLTTKEEYLDNFAAIKGEKYAKFMRETASILTQVEIISQCLDNRFGLVPVIHLSFLTTVAINYHAAAAGITDKVEIDEAIKECLVMIKAIDRAREYGKGVM